MLEALKSGSPDNPTLSLVLITHRRERLFRQALQTLIDQDAPKDRYEVIVVDNDIKPNPEVKGITEEASAFIHVRYIYESQLGVSHARNAGCKASIADYFGLFDDDAKAPRDYVSRLLDILSAKHPDICGGPIHPFYETARPAWFKDEYEIREWDSNARWLNSNEYLSGANIVFRQGLLDKSGWFDPSLSKRGQKVWYGGESSVQINAWKIYKELRVWYDPELIIYHLTPPEKMNLGFRLKHCFNMGRSVAWLWIPTDRVATIHHAILRALPFFLTKFVGKLTFGIWFRSRPRYQYWQNYFFEVISQDVQKLGGHMQILKDSLLSAHKKEKNTVKA